jgi:hypothetical protein
MPDSLKYNKAKVKDRVKLRKVLHGHGRGREIIQGKYRGRFNPAAGT